MIEMVSHDPSCAELSARIQVSAERELAAFAIAVEELYGHAEAQQSLEDWLEAMQSTDLPVAPKTADWRSVTISAAVQLARRVNARVAMDSRSLERGQWRVATETVIGNWPAHTKGHERAQARARNDAIEVPGANQ